MSVSDFENATPRDTYNFIRAHSEKRDEDIEQQWDYVRSMMWASIFPHITKKIVPSDLITLKRDGRLREMTGWEIQELKRWNEECDRGMDLVPLFPKQIENG